MELARKPGTPDGERYLAPFSPVILETRVPEAHLEVITSAAAEVFGDPELAARHAEGSPMLSNVKQHVELLPRLEGTPALAWLTEACDRYVRHVAGEVGRADASLVRTRIVAIWANRQVAHDFVPLHLHDGLLSAVAYLRVPPAMHEEMDEAGRLAFFDGRPTDPNLVRHRYVITPAPGNLYIFPAWLQHMVYPFRGAGERWALAFNAGIASMGPPDAGEHARAESP